MIHKIVCISLIIVIGLFGQNHVLNLDGAGDYVSLPSTIINGSEFTVEGWCSMEGIGGGLDQQNTIFAQRDYDTQEGHPAIILQAESPTVGEVTRFNIRSTIGPNDVVENPMFAYGEWHHYAGVVSQDSVYLFLDGVMVDATSNNQTGNFSTSVDQVEIGRHYHSIGYDAGYFNGYIDDLRIWGGALSAQEIMDVKNGATEFIQYAMLADWDFEGSTIQALDQSGNGHVGVLVGDAAIIENGPTPFEFGNVLVLDGDNDYATLPNPIIQTNEFTIEMWANMMGTGGGLDQQNTLFEQRDYETEANRSAILFTAENYPAGRLTRFTIRSNQGVSDRAGTDAPEYGSWHHYTGVVSQDSVYLYLDGELVSAVENTQSGVFNYSIDHVDIGRHYHSFFYDAGYFNGYIDELKFWSVARTSAEIQADVYGQLTGAEENLVGYYNFENQSVQDLSISENHGSLVNGAAIIPYHDISNQCNLFGDTNDDGFVNISDVINMVYYTIGLPVGEINEACADLSDDDNIDITDIVMLVEYLLGE